MKKITRKELIDVGFDKIVVHKDGTHTFKRSFFYRHGMTSEKWAEQAQKRLNVANFNIDIKHHIENWQAWPKTSYFEVNGIVTRRWKE